MSHTLDFNQNAVPSTLPPLPVDSPVFAFLSAGIRMCQSIDPITGCLKWTRYVTIPLANSVFEKDSSLFHFRASNIVTSKSIVYRTAWIQLVEFK